MTGLFTGIIGSLIGVGIQAAVGGIPVHEEESQAIDVLRRGGFPVPPENWFTQKPPEEPRMEQVYSRIGEHVTAAMQILGPIAKSLKDYAAYSESQSSAAKALAPREKFTGSKASYKSVEISVKKKYVGKSSCLCKDTPSTNTSKTKNKKW